MERLPMLKKIVISVTILLAVLLGYFLLNDGIFADENTGEKIIYVIRPLGRAEYNDLGMVELSGKMVKLVVFKTDMFGFDDTEKIYSDPDTLLPIRVEREIRWFGKENIIEEYDQKNFTVTIKKFQNNKQVNEWVLKEDGPIDNAILLPFYLRKIPRLDIGWNLNVRIPNKFKLTLVSIDEIKVFGKKFKSYHFTSDPDRFEIWINKDSPRVPLKIKGKSGFNYNVLIKKYSPGRYKWSPPEALAGGS